MKPGKTTKKGHSIVDIFSAAALRGSSLVPHTQPREIGSHQMATRPARARWLQISCMILIRRHSPWHGKNLSSFGYMPSYANIHKIVRLVRFLTNKDGMNINDAVSVYDAGRTARSEEISSSVLSNATSEVCRVPFERGVPFTKLCT